MSNNPIGIYDSGIGGLTVANAIHQLMPQEALLYFGDTAHFPYGEKSPDSIKYYSIRIADFLVENGAKCIVIACNTASSIAYEAVKKHVKNKVPVISVIDPVVNAVAKNDRLKKVGVIATKATIKTDAYAKKIKAISDKEVASLATPLLAPMIEEGFFNNNISKTIIHSYLSKPKLKKIDALILACTHYPLIQKEIAEYYHNEILIMDSAEIAAQEVKNVLNKGNLLCSKTSKNKSHFYVSDYTKSFESSTKIFFKGKINLEKHGLWDNE